MTLVVDASVAVEFVLGSSTGRQARDILTEQDGDLHAPELLIAESLSALRRLERHGELTGDRAHEAVRDLLDLPIRRYPTVVLAPRIWGLRGRFTVYDAHYLALAEILDATLFTGDQRFAGQARDLVRVIVPRRQPEA